LAALYLLKAQQDLKAAGDLLEKVDGDIAKSVSINISIGSSSYETETNSSSSTAQGSILNAGGGVNITAIGSGAQNATNGDITVIGSTVTGQNIDLTATNAISLLAAENTVSNITTASSSSWGVGVSLGATTGLLVSGSKSSGNENENGTTYTETILTASNTLTTVSGGDTNIIGAQASGNTVGMNVGGDLNIVSLQDSDNYTASSSSVGGTISFGISSTGSASKSNTNSTYSSVIEQSGIYAGTGGFDITVSGNTDLKGAVISSTATADKNKLDTGSLTYSDIKNKAEYSSESSGWNYNTGKDVETKDQGLTPALSVSSEGNADSTTKSAISSGTIIVRNGNTDLSNLSRDTTNSINALEKIFDKKTVQEQQELAKLFGEEVFKAIGDLGLEEGSLAKAMLDAFAGGLMAKLGGSSFASGAASAGLNQLLMTELANITDPAVLQWASAIAGAVAAKIVGGNPQTGASVAASETKNNYLTHEQYAEYQKQLQDLDEKRKNGSITKEEYDAAVKDVTDSWSKVDKEQDSKIDYNSFKEVTEIGVDMKGIPEYVDPTETTATASEYSFDWKSILTGLGRGILGLQGDDYYDRNTTYQYWYSVGNRATPLALSFEGLNNPFSISGEFVIGYNGTLAQTTAVDAWKLWLSGSTLTNTSQYNASQSDNNSSSTVGGTSQGSSNAKTTAELIKDVTIKDGKYYSPKATIDEIGQLEAKGVDFSKLDSKVMSSRPSTEGGTSRVVKYSDSDGTKFIVHEVTDQSGNVLHRDFDAVRIESGQLINKAEK
jgi:hypothetical protein